MATPTTQLNATEQDTLVKQIGLALLRAAPRDWRRVTAQYRAVGRYHELTGEVLTEDGTAQEWVATHDIAALFGRLRAGMYREGRGTWFNARYVLDHPSSYNLEYDREEPRWNLAPPAQAYSDELRMFPRSEENVPEWLMRRMSGAGAEQPAPRFRVARIFDGQDATGRPVLNRPELDADELDRLFEYLGSAPVVLSERGLDLDRLSPTPVPKVPVAFHTDGVWIWPAAVNYYLQEYNVAPEAELVAHIRSTGFSVPEVPEQALQAAAAHIGRGAPPMPAPPQPPQPPQQPPLPARTPRAAAEQTTVATPIPPPPVPEPEPAHEEDFDLSALDQPEEEHLPPPVPPLEQPTAFSPAARPGPPGPPTMVAPPVEHEAPESAPPPVPDSGPPAPRVPTAPKPPLAVLDALRTRLDELGIPADSYRIGAPAEHAWSMEKIDAGWRVGWYDKDLINPAVFGDAEDAAAFMLGKLLLDPGRRRARTPDLDETPITGLRSNRPRDERVREEPPLDTRGRDELLRNDRVREEPLREERPLDARFRDAPGPGDRQLDERPREERFREEPPRDDRFREEPPRDERFREEPPRDDRFREELPHEERFREEPPRDERFQEERPREERQFSSEPLPKRSVARSEEPESGGVNQPTMLAPPVSPPPSAPPLTPRREPQRAEPVRPAASGSSAGSGGSGNQQWPIQPMPGEPPLTLFRGKEMRELPPGSELDRFGPPNGNLTYAAGTPFEERSLVPEWVNRPYHLYRVQRPVEALAGVAIPWFNQPGGGAAYLLPTSVEELLERGDLVELDPGEPPVD
ncbi:TNT domain-containing protein [Amycolatopsis pigmentata]|uniref:TNT domain-containing protein n=1 Tax=Amycolatopsis pigmentata TaxID=450801 RepID=A0ABW5G2I1_9PSEU